MQTEPLNRKGARLRICEIYESNQGEGLLTGTSSVFIRTSGCNLRCWFCDTPFASWNPEGEYLSVDEIVTQSLSFKSRHVVLTGGEPMIFPQAVELCQKLHELGFHITIETAGTIYQALYCDLVSISPKLSSSTPDESAGSWMQLHEERRERLEVVRKWMAQPYQLKFVIDRPTDCDEVQDYLARLGNHDPRRVLLMPQGITAEQLQQRTEWLQPWCEQAGYVFCRRLHIDWYGNQRGT